VRERIGLRLEHLSQRHELSAKRLRVDVRSFRRSDHDVWLRVRGRSGLGGEGTDQQHPQERHE
jgi:hypothetical protein